MNWLTDESKNNFDLSIKVNFPNEMFKKEQDNQDEDILMPLYKYDEAINFCFARFHYYITRWIAECARRVSGGNEYVTVGLKGDLDDYLKGIKALKKFFKKNNIEFILNEEYEKMFEDFTHLKRVGIKFFFEENQQFPECIKDEPIFFLKRNNDFKAINYLIFGASKSKPDIVAKNLLEGDLTILNDDKVLVYDKEISESVLYSDFNQWWSKNSKKYGWYNPKNDMNEIEYKVQQYYISNYKKDENPVIIPQVYIHYDPKNEKMREMYGGGKVLKFQRMDFLIIYQGKRVIIEIDGKTHTPQYDLQAYSEQCQYDRNMRFLGYDVFRLGGYELTNDFDKTVKEFFEQLADYLKISHN